MARVAAAKAERYPWYVRLILALQRRKYGVELEPARLWGRMPLAFVWFTFLYRAIDRGRSPLEPGLRALVQVRISQINWCGFCVDSNGAAALERHVAPQKLEALPRYESSPLFSERERAALAYAEAATDPAKGVDEGCFARLRAQLDEQAILELTALVAFQNLSSKFNAALAVAPQGLCPLEPPKTALAGDMHAELAEAMAAALDAREHETGLHSKRVACHTLVVARRFTAEPQILRQVYWGALLHDIGKIGIPDRILLKNGPLSADEWGVMRGHPEIGHRILASLPGMATAADIVIAHEERFDGSGYPRGLAGMAIPLWARLFAVIDTLDAMTSDRLYRKALSFEAAKAEIADQAGRQFDPQAVRAFMAEEDALRAMVGAKCADPQWSAPL
ncbi:MAG TPA: HD domain-containing phosphohydrolase [Burkholderiales bacterium]|nr:HD domain-containing phosphohydrolase [Burkholderiales bacterium]